MAVHNITQVKDSQDAEYVHSTAILHMHTHTHTHNTGISFVEAGTELDILTP